MCPSGTRLGPEHDLRYVFVLDIFCQQLWGVVQLGGVCVPFGHRVGGCTFSEICICIGYILPTNGVMCQWHIYFSTGHILPTTGSPLKEH